MADLIYEGVRVLCTIQENPNRVVINETSLGLWLKVGLVANKENTALLTTEQARALAAQIYRLAKRVDDRLIKQEEQKKLAEDAQRQAQAIANVQPGVTATQSRLLTRGPAERGIDKVAINTEKTVTAVQTLTERLDTILSEQTKIVLEYGV
jgi:hypothetical protein